MFKALRNILFSYALCYIDDVLVMSANPEQHGEHLTEIFTRFDEIFTMLFRVCKHY